MESDSCYSDMFKGVHAKAVASVLNELCAGGKLALFSVDGDMLAFYPLQGTEFRARQIGKGWSIYGTPLSYVRFQKEGISTRVDGLMADGALVFSVPTDGGLFREGNDFDSFITISYG